MERPSSLAMIMSDPITITECRLLTLLKKADGTEHGSPIHTALVIEAISLALQCGFDAGFYYKAGDLGTLKAVINMPGGALKWDIPAKGQDE